MSPVVSAAPPDLRSHATESNDTAARSSHAVDARPIRGVKRCLMSLENLVSGVKSQRSRDTGPSRNTDVTETRIRMTLRQIAPARGEEHGRNDEGTVRRAADACAPGSARGMSARVLDGQALANRMQRDIKPEVAAFAARHGRPPGLAIVLVGDDPASHVYVNHKVKAGTEAGFR